MKVKTIKLLIELQKFWNLETLRIKDDPVDKKLYDKQMLEQFDESIKFSDGRGEVKLPRKFDNIDVAKIPKNIWLRDLERKLRLCLKIKKQ
ncbi:hypothetical protein CEXT_587781 [Caerostris extrusa]|uniref:Uncharacterized protein n=1 Tax=Caerostris extrusa TaxID=172846 RepID=A0AAV4NP89_CAEEX|nr:hypothetical protein CEXT_587781 [Caerostris extrusa]